MHVLTKLALSLCMITPALYAMEAEHKKEAQAEVAKKEAAESCIIGSYKKERDHAFITALLAKDPHNFPDADKVADLDSEYIEMSIPQLDGQTRKYTFKQNILVCCFDAKPVGFVRTFDLSQGKQNGAGQIAQIAVKEEVRRKGVGKLLLTQGVEKLKSAGVKMIILDTMADNVSAHALYEKVGFTKMVDAGSHYLYSMQLSS
jgi:ribosomal protein S18 acetylase RimI-like enzyme